MYAGCILFVDCLVFVAFCFACAAQFKMPGAYWLRHSLVGSGVMLGWRLLKLTLAALGKLCRWLGKKVPPAVKKTGCAVARLVRKLLRLLITGTLAVVHGINRVAKWIFNTVHRFLSLLPLTWQWLLTGFLMTMVLYICLRSYRTGWILVGFGIFFGMILYGAHAFGILMDSARNMGKGDLDTKVEDQFLLGAFREFSGHLNALAGVAKVAAQEQMKSERMKTELITNVSHDIKTPLTSIINYVDLLEKPHTPQEEQQYLEVLGRKSQQLKKLIEDLMEMSKASSGSMTVNVEWLDIGETVNQALGEFADKLNASRLNVVYQPPQEMVYVRADGRLTWRVLSNLLGNTVKYAMPGTRLYFDLTATNELATLSLKNISREPLNVDAQELMERFVRGDASRNTEGSGLGLNIAKSLMEVQGGQLELTVDGDLFKVTLTFPVTK
jgi:signal transduction histidine kinase